MVRAGFIAFLCAACVVTGAAADRSGKTKQFQTLDRLNGGSRSVLLSREDVYIPGLPGEVPRDLEYRGPYLDLAKRAANRHHIPAALFCALSTKKVAGTPRRCHQRVQLDWRN